jgi:2-hydroxy-6-oxonona-2,4-dienedioate hydrolase
MERRNERKAGRFVLLIDEEPMAIENDIAYRSVWTHMMTTSFSQRFIDVDGVKTRYVQAGDPNAPAVIMLHGTAGSWEGFSANLASHARHFNCYALDMIGSGFSSRPDIDYEIPTYVDHVNKFMDAVGIKSASLIGTSLGAWVAARFALTHPRRIEKLELLSAAGLFANASNMNRIRNVRSKAVDNPSWSTIKPIFDHLLYREESRIPDIIAVRQAVYRQPGMQRTMEHILCLQDPEIRPRNLISEAEWTQIACDTLVIGSLADKDEYLETARRVSQLIPRAQYVEMPNVGHWPQFEDPDTFNPLSIQFLHSRPAV